MPEWTRHVRRRLGSLAISPKRREEIVREIAGFLEDGYLDSMTQGEDPRSAGRRTLARTGGWPNVARAIEQVEGVMTRRFRTLWLPGLLVGALAQGLLVALGALGAWGTTLWRPPLPPVLLFWPWLFALVGVGALGAELCRRRGGTRLEALAVALFPTTPWLVFFPLGAARILGEDISTGERMLVLGVVGLNWAVVPALALLAGAWARLHVTEPAARTT